MRFLVLSHTHSLLPFAYRLQLSGAEVQPVVTVAAFEAAWRGKIEAVKRDSKGRVDLSFVEDYDQADTIILTDDWKMQQHFSHWQAVHHNVFGVTQQRSGQTDSATGAIRIGGWFTGEKLIAPHLLIVDRGAWASGIGPAVDGSLTLVRVDNEETIKNNEALVEPHLDELKSSGFRGLVQFDLNFQTSDGEPEVSAVVAGWPFLHTHAFLSELEDFSGLLESGTNPPASTQGLLPKKFVTVVPISRPPWPTRKARFRFDLVPIEGLTPLQMGRVFWHDVQMDTEAGRLTTAGLDGLIGVARGAADTNELALVRALEIALRIRLPEKQFRTDAARKVQSALAELEGRFGVLV